MSDRRQKHRSAEFVCAVIAGIPWVLLAIVDVERIVVGHRIVSEALAMAQIPLFILFVVTVGLSIPLSLMLVVLRLMRYPAFSPLGRLALAFSVTMLFALATGALTEPSWFITDAEGSWRFEAFGNERF